MKYINAYILMEIKLFGPSVRGITTFILYNIRCFLRGEFVVWYVSIQLSEHTVSQDWNVRTFNLVYLLQNECHSHQSDLGYFFCLLFTARFSMQTI
jgi:hypothetical protein